MRKILSLFLVCAILFSIAGCKSSEMRHCPGCNSALSNETRYCPNCGEELVFKNDNAEDDLHSQKQKKDPVLWDGSIADSYESGEGTADNPYEIANASQLAFFAQETNAGRVYYGQYFYLSNDILLNNPTDIEGYFEKNNNFANINFWIPIGTREHPFEANFFGSNYSIIGLAIDTYDKELENAGLFGYMSKGYIGYVHINSSYIYAPDVVGGIVATVFPKNTTSATIEKCSSDANLWSRGKITRSAPNSDDMYMTISDCGGIIGFVQATSGDVNVRGCINYSDINCYLTNEYIEKLKSIYDFKYMYYLDSTAVGGIVGGSSVSTDQKSLYISNCINYGTISCKWNDRVTAGGIIGSASNQTTICDSLNMGYIQGDKEDFAFGGIAGNISASYYVKYCYVSNCYIIPEYCSAGIGASSDHISISIYTTTIENAKSIKWLSENLYFNDKEYEINNGKIHILPPKKSPFK